MKSMGAAVGCAHAYSWEESMEILKIVFPACMVIGAVGSMIVNIVDHGGFSTTLQWLSAAGLYTALMMRNIEK